MTGKYIADYWVSGMQRLSIVDLLNGGQPQVNEREKIYVVHNGEIYNHKDLRSQLVAKGYRFKSVSDTEVILHGYEEWEIDGLLDKIEGMHAFAIVTTFHLLFILHVIVLEKNHFILRRKTNFFLSPLIFVH